MNILAIDHTKKVLADLTKLATDVIDMAKKGKNIHDIIEIAELCPDLEREIVAAIPEIKTLHGDDLADLATLAFEALKSLIPAAG